MAQIRAIGSRHGNPTLALYGASVGDGSFTRLGQMISGLPIDSRLEYVEATHAVAALGVEAERVHEAAKATLPEFLLLTGGNLSGSALAYSYAQFVCKAKAVRGRFFDAVEEALGMAASMSSDSVAPRYRIDAPPPLDADAKGILANVVLAVNAQLLTRPDAIRQLQAIGLVPADVDPDLYAVRALGDIPVAGVVDGGGATGDVIVPEFA